MIARKLQAEIQTNGPIPFTRFMQTALYDPESGYYRTSRNRFGTTGDFYTAEQLPAFGDLLATYLRLHNLRRVLELGAGRADLGLALSQFRYQAFDWHTPELPSHFEGLILANEFFDALPVTVLTKGSEWRELLVGTDSNGFAFNADRSPSADLKAYAERYGTKLSEGDILEVAPDLPTWANRIASMLVRGRVLIFDYGYNASEILRYPQGTMMSYRNHRASTDVFANPGEQDITAHVNFSALIDSFERAGLTLIASASMDTWALTQWDGATLQAKWDAWTANERLQWKTLVFGMGPSFRVLEFSKQ